MLSINDKMPDFALNAMVNSKSFDAFKVISNKDYEGQWYCIFFWPKDFTFVCPTEIAEFGRKEEEFKKCNCAILGCSVDNEFVHLAWHQDNKLLNENVKFPMLSDIKRELCTALGVLNTDGVADRATFIVNPEGLIKFASVTDGKVGRNVDEVLRVLSALQTDGLTPCGWKPGEKLLEVK